jgi:hypothetical protein
VVRTPIQLPDHHSELIMVGLLAKKKLRSDPYFSNQTPWVAFLELILILLPLDTCP